MPLWARVAVPILLLSAVHLGAPHVGWRSPYFDLAYSATAGVAAVAIVVGIRRYRPRARAAWWCVAVGQAMFAVGDIVYVIQYNILGSESYPGPSDLLYLASYPLTAAGLIILVRHRTPTWHLPSVLDALLLASGAGLLFWVYLIAPLRASVAGYGHAYTAATLAYPVADLLVLAVAMFLVLGVGARPPAYHLLIGGLAANLCTDVVYAVQSVLGIYQGGLIDAGWLLAYLLLAAAATHPSMRRLDERSPVGAPDSTWPRLLALAVASLTAPAVLAIQHARGAPTHIYMVVACASLMFLLVLARMALLVQVQRREAITDALTGLHTRRFFEESLRVEADRRRRHGGGLGVVLFDVDHFKKVNDTYGHPGGDRVLCEVARRLKAAARSGDIVARYGGEEFGLLLPGAGEHDLTAVGERIRRQVAGVPIAVDAKTVITVTVSGGTAVLADGTTADQVVRAADRALYAAKHAGRNRIVGAEPRQVAPV